MTYGNNLLSLVKTKTGQMKVREDPRHKGLKTEGRGLNGFDREGRIGSGL